MEITLGMEKLWKNFHYIWERSEESAFLYLHEVHSTQSKACKVQQKASLYIKGAENELFDPSEAII